MKFKHIRLLVPAGVFGIYGLLDLSNAEVRWNETSGEPTMSNSFRISATVMRRAASAFFAILPLTVCTVEAKDKSAQASASPKTPPHASNPGFSTAGTMNQFFCGKGSAFFSNVFNQMNILTQVPTDGSCGVAGVQWNGLKNLPFNQISFDVLGGGCNDNLTFGVFVFLNESTGPVTLACEDFVQIPLSNGFTRYVFRPSSPAKLNSLVIAHVGSSGVNAQHVIGNFLFNGNQAPFIQLNNPHPCPAGGIGCGN